MLQRRRGDRAAARPAADAALPALERLHAADPRRGQGRPRPARAAELHRPGRRELRRSVARSTRNCLS